MSAFGETLKRIRLEKNLSQEQLAELLGTTKQVISRYETGQRSPKVSVAIRYAAALGVSIRELSGEGPDDETDESPVDALSTTERQLITIYRALNENGQTILINTARGLAVNPDMKKDGISSTETA